MQDKDLDAIVFLVEHGHELALEGDLHVKELLALLDYGLNGSADGTSEKLSIALRQHVVMSSYQYSPTPYDQEVAQMLLQQAEPDLQAYLRRLPRVIRDAEEVFGDTIVDNAFLHRAYMGMVEVVIAETQEEILHYQRKIAAAGDILETDLLDTHRIYRRMKARGEDPNAPEDRPWQEIMQEFLQVEEERLPALRLYREELMKGLDRGEYVL